VVFAPVDSQLDLVALEKRVLARWRERDVVAETRRRRESGEPWIFYEGPPTANARPGVHHVLARVFKDLYPRFHTMRGRAVPRKGGWDCHGLPVEIEVEKELGFTRKDQIEEYGVAEFNQLCRDSVKRYVEAWSSLTERSGVWIDTASAYWTLENDYVESVWWLLRQMWDKGLLYEGHRVSPYCARCGTALSSHEMGQPGVYSEVTDPSVWLRFPIEGQDADLLVWTTTPWTLISNVAAAVGPDLTYVRVAAPDGGRDLVMAEAALPRLFGDDATPEPAERFAGRSLVGLRYERPFDIVPLDEGSARRVVAGDFVSTEEGSGIVHLAPAFGEDDYQIARAEQLPVLNPVDADGAFDHTVPRWNGRFVKDADREIIADLEARRVLVREEPYVHAYPHCWRCGTPLIYWAKTSWFIRTSECRKELLEQNDRIGWYPEHIKHGRFGNWLETNIDWALSRDRYWGTPLPVWRCAGGHDTCVGSVEELEQLAGRSLADLDLHRPFVDEVTVRCPVDGCGATARRLPPVLDAWFDSGSMPSAQHHYPFENSELFDAQFPADFICEAIDQTRGWFYSLLAINTLVFGSTPYRNCVVLELIVDEQGQKMSKSKGNVLDPWFLFDTFGADAVRWLFFAASQPWVTRRVSEHAIQESTRKTLLTLWNVYSFFVTYANAAAWEAGADAPDAEHVLDRWVLGELDHTVATVTDALERFDSFGAANRLAQFVDDLSNWYVRRSRPRFWESDDGAPHATLHRCLVTVSQLLAPFCPFLADELYTGLTGDLSVHTTDWPEVTGAYDADLAARVAAVRRIVSLGRAARTDAKVKVRQPLARALLLHPGVDLDEPMRAEIRSELNVKTLEDIDTLGGLISWSVKPNFRSLGPRLGERVGDVQRALAAADGSELQQRLETDGFVEVAGERLTSDDLDVRAVRHESFAFAEEGGWGVALDLDVTEELRVEGTAREIIRALNELRREVGLEVSDRVRLVLDGGPRVTAAVESHAEWISGEVLAVDLRLGPASAHRLEVDGEPLAVDLDNA
jgi:isoleucyl-tRNA synthetase